MFLGLAFFFPPVLLGSDLNISSNQNDLYSDYIHHKPTFVCLNSIPIHFVCCCLVSLLPETTNCLLCTFDIPPMILQSYIRFFCLISSESKRPRLDFQIQKSLIPLSFFPVHPFLFFWMLSIPRPIKNAYIFLYNNVDLQVLFQDCTRKFLLK